MKNNLRRILFISALIAVLIVISVCCLIFGRGHTVYLDNKSIEGTDYSSYANIDIVYKGEKIVSLGKAERGSVALTGQTLNIQFTLKKTKAAAEQVIDTVIELPYNMDGIVINIPAYIEGADIEQYMSEFVPARTEEDTADDEVPVTDEFGMTTDEE